MLHLFVLQLWTEKQPHSLKYHHTYMLKPRHLSQFKYLKKKLQKEVLKLTDENKQQKDVKI